MREVREDGLLKLTPGSSPLTCVGVGLAAFRIYRLVLYIECYRSLRRPPLSGGSSSMPHHFKVVDIATGSG